MNVIMCVYNCVSLQMRVKAVVPACTNVRVWKRLHEGMCGYVSMHQCACKLSVCVQEWACTSVCMYVHACGHLRGGECVCMYICMLVRAAPCARVSVAYRCVCAHVSMILLT